MKFLNPPVKPFLKQSTKLFKYSFILWAIFLLGSISSFKLPYAMPFYIVVYNWTVWLYPVVAGSLLGLAHYTYRQHNHEDALKQLWLFSIVATGMLAYAASVSLLPMIMLLVIPFALVFRSIPKVVFARPAFMGFGAKIQRKATIGKRIRTTLSEPLPS